MPEHYLQNPAWRAAIELGTKIALLAEDIPESARDWLAKELRQIATDIPANLAIDLAANRQVRPDWIIRLETIVTLIDRIYPALDTGDVEGAAQQLRQALKEASDVQPDSSQ